MGLTWGVIGLRFIKLEGQGMKSRNRESSGAPSCPAIWSRLHGERPWSGASCWLVGLLSVLMFSVLSFAQTGATLRGIVSDQQHAVIPGAQATLINQATGVERVVTTGGDGSYYFTAINPGTYTLRIESKGFATRQQTGIELSAQETRGINVEMQLGQTAETVTVSGAAAEIVQTETGAKQYTLDTNRLDNLSLIGRQAQELLRVLPGVVAPNANAMMTVTMQGSGRFDAYNVNGHSGSENQFELDGARVQHQGDAGTQMLVLNNDMLQEVRIQVSNFSAESSAAGIQVTGITKSGGRDFHGELYDYLRPNALLANDRSNNYAGISKPANTYQYIGGNIGGPLTKGRNKLFFFFGAEIQRQTIDDGTFLAVVPTQKQRTGDFSEFLSAPAGKLLWNQPQTVKIPQGFPGAGGPAPNNNLAPYAAAMGMGLMSLYPLPNYTDPNNRYNYAGHDLYPANRHQEVGRVDYNVSDRAKLYVRLASDLEKLAQPYGSWFKQSDVPTKGDVQAKGHGEAGAVSLVNIISPTVTNEVLLTMTANQLVHTLTKPQDVSLQAVNGQGFVGLFPPSTGWAPYRIYSQAYPVTTMQQYENYPLSSEEVQLAATENFAVFRGSHAFKFGGFWQRVRVWDNNGNCQYGCIYLNSNVTPGSTGNDFGDLLVGRPYQFSQTTVITQAHWLQTDYEGYAQDSWKVRRNLTLEYGLRLSYFPLGHDTRGNSTAFYGNKYDPTQGLLINGDPMRPNGMLIAKRDQIPQSGASSAGIAWGPRLGFAWDITGSSNTVIRGGFGMFHNRPGKNGNATQENTNPPWVYSAAIDAVSGASLGGGTGLTYATISQVDPFSRVSAVSLSALRPDSARNPTSMSMNVSVVKKLPGAQVLEVAYVGMLGRHEIMSHSRNMIPQGALLQGTVGNADLSVLVNRVALSTQAKNTFRPFPAYSTVSNPEYENTTNYHSLQATLSRRVSRNLTYLVSYTFSKCLGTGTGNGGGGLNPPFGLTPDPFDERGRTYGPQSTDRTHVLNLTYIYALPKVASNNWFAKGALNGWQLSGITSYISSAPLRFTLTGDIANVGIAQAYFGTDVGGGFSPIYLSNPTRDANTVGGKHFDVNAVAMPGFGSQGPWQPPYYLRAQGSVNFDVTLFKEFPIGQKEGRKLQVRFAAFDVFNQAFAGPGDIITSLATTCNKKVNGIPNGSGGTVNGVCDPSGGFSFTPTSLSTFGQIVTKRGHRIMEAVVKFYF